MSNIVQFPISKRVNIDALKYEALCLMEKSLKNLVEAQELMDAVMKIEAASLKGAL